MTAQSEESASQVDRLEPGREPCADPSVGETHAERIAQLFERYHGKLVKALAVQTRSWEEARDIAAQAFEAMLSHERPGSVGFFGAYLYRTARNLATNQMKRQAMQRRKETLVQNDGTVVNPSPEPLCVEAERQAVLRRAVDRLPAHLRMAVILRVYDELSDDEIVGRFAADGVNVTDRTIRRYIAAAYEQIRLDVVAAENPSRNNRP